MRYIAFAVFFILIGCSSAVKLNQSSATGIKGTVVNELKQPVGDVFVYLYHSISSKLIGPADFMEKTSDNGTFFFDVPEGNYYVVARKRSHGGDAGPLKQGDRAAIYQKNPVKVLPNKTSEIEIVLPERKTFYFKRTPFGNTSLTVRVTPDTDKNLKLLIYRGESLKRAPDYIVDFEKNKVLISLDDNEKYVLVVREELREKVSADEIYIEYGPFSPSKINGEIVIELQK